jgi:hypothetical protein
MAENVKDNAGAPGKVWISDRFEGCTYVHGVDGFGSSQRLEAGDEVPAGFEDQLGRHIPTTRTQPRSSRVREIAGDYGDEVPDFDPRDATVPEVNAYLEENPEDVQRVLDLERSGAARTGILRRT